MIKRLAFIIITLFLTTLPCNIYADEKVEDDVIYLSATDLCIQDLITNVSSLFDKKFVVGDNVLGHFTYYNEKPLTKKQFWQVFITYLKENNFQLKKIKGNEYEISSLIERDPTQFKDCLSKPKKKREAIKDYRNLTGM